MKRRAAVSSGVIALVALVAVVFWSQFTIFVVQPIGAVPEGRTLIISRLTKMNFIDSADGMCDRIMDGVSLLCRAVVMGKIAEASHIYARFPYSGTLYAISTGGKSYGR